MTKPGRFTSQYMGPLSRQDAADGINAARRNALRLFEDSELLVFNGRFPSALALAFLSIEETGKVGIIKSIGMATDPAELRTHWREYRSHKSKNALWAAVDFVQRGARKLDDFAGLFDPNQDHQQVLDELKPLAFYTQCIRAGRWSEPPNAIPEDVVRSIVKIAGVFATRREVSAEELEAHFRHVGPVRHGPPHLIKQAHVRSYAEMQARGSKPPGSNQAEDLIHGRAPG